MLTSIRVTTYQPNPFINMKVISSEAMGLKENEALEKGRIFTVKLKQGRIEVTKLLFYLKLVQVSGLEKIGNHT